jgi:3-phenylpropionate/trans-cinnamate dioxygenase ferredoxin reductase subunit
VFAAGDVAKWYHRGLGARLRVEHRLNAGDQGRAVASSILGCRKPFVPVPYFWSRQYANRLQGFGMFPHDAEVDICEGAVSNGRFVASYKVGGELVGVLGWNAPKDIVKYLTALSSFWGSY